MSDERRAYTQPVYHTCLVPPTTVLFFAHGGGEARQIVLLTVYPTATTTNQCVLCGPASCSRDIEEMVQAAHSMGCQKPLLTCLLMCRCCGTPFTCGNHLFRSRLRVRAVRPFVCLLLHEGQCMPYTTRDALPRMWAMRLCMALCQGVIAYVGGWRRLLL